MAAQAHIIPASPSAIVPAPNSDVARLLAGTSRLQALRDEAATDVAEAEPEPGDTVQAVRADLVALIAADGGGAHPDAALLALGRRWQASAERCDRARAALDEACGGTREVEPPEALYYRETDGFTLACLARGKHHETGRRWFSPGAVETLRTYTFVDPWGRPIPYEQARQAEILAAHDGWTAEIAAGEEASGYTAAEVEDEASTEENRELRRRIMTARAVTLDGVMVKARVAGWCWGGSAEMVTDVASEAESGHLTSEWVAASAVADLVAMLERAA